jgi:TolA-binding protein
MTDDQLSELGKRLPWDRPDDARREAVRSGLLVAAAEGDGRPRARWGLALGGFAVGALAAAAAMLVTLRGAHTVASEPRAQIEASSAADFERIRNGNEEIVRVHRGKLSLAVPGAHVVVATGDAEIEGEGSYDVAVVDDTLREVDVHTGSATVRVRGQQAVFLAAGASWTAKPAVIAETIEPAAPTAPPAPEPVETPTPARVASPAKPSTSTSTSTSTKIEAREPLPAVTEPSPSPSPPPSPSPKSTIEQHFQTGWQLLKSNQPAEAARELGAAADAGGDDPLAADARYFQAIALVKAGRKTEAEHAYIAFLDKARDSLRRGRAAVALARLIAERGDTKSARAWYESALLDADPDVVAAARAGMAALAQ